MITTKRIYDPPKTSDGIRILVDRLWPRGVAKKDANIDIWLKEIAPSNELRIWFDHDPNKWNDFQKKYAKELKKKEGILDLLRRLGKEKRVTLLYGAKDLKVNHAVALKQILETP